MSEKRLPAKITEWMPAKMPAKAGGKAGKAGGKAGKAGGKAGPEAVGMAVAHLLHLLLHNSGESTAAIKRLPAKITYVRASRRSRATPRDVGRLPHHYHT